MDTIALQESWGWLLPLCAAAYLLGSISSAILVCRLFGYPDPRTQGSSNPGATNVLRIGGKPAAALTLLGDVLKGTVPVLVAYGLGLSATAAALVGRFHRALEGFEHTFHFSRPGAHDTPKHLAKLRGLLDAAPDHGDAQLARAVLDAAASLPTLPSLPTRIVHGDLKATNLRFDGDRARCLLDLDTLAHGTLAVELGDALRSWCNATNEADPEARFDPTIFAAALEGWAPVVRDLVTEAERRSLVGGVETITLELASRFAADLFEDRYFGWDEARFDSRRAHNRARTHAHLSLARSLRAQRDALEAKVERAFR